MEVVLAFVVFLGLAERAVPALAAEYVGSARCSGCHEAGAHAWRGSHHELAMAEATGQTVLGDFDDTVFMAHGVTSRFYRQDGDFLVRTDSPDGEL